MTTLNIKRSNNTLLALKALIEAGKITAVIDRTFSLEKTADAMRHLEKGRVVIFAAGTGNPYFTTDSAASLRAVEVGADVMIKGTKVDGIYDKDPMKYDDAVKYETVSFDEAVQKRLGVMDTTAIVMCRENNLPVKVFNMNNSGDLMRLIMGENIGTTVKAN